MIKNLPLQRRIIAIILFLGLLLQFQTVFACEYKNGKLQLVCCCDKPGDMTKDCDQDNSSCLDAGDPVTIAACCEVSFQAGPSATIIGSKQHNRQVLQLDAPQPPPLLTSFDLQAAMVSYPTNGITSTLALDYFGVATGTQTYRLTQRFRI